MGMPTNSHRHQALSLAAQLPDNRTEALLVLQAATELIETFYVADEHTPTHARGNVLTFEAKGG